MNRESFADLEERLDPFLRRNEVKAVASSGSAITTRTRLAITLRWLAGGSYIDLCFGWGVAYSTFYSDRGIIWPTIEAIDQLFRLGFPINNEHALEELRMEFSEHSNGAMDGLITVIDGLAVRVRKPFRWECENSRDYRYRKGGFAIIVMAGSDVNGKFTFGTAKDSGSTNDSVSWETTALCDKLKDGKLNDRYFFGGDEAFSNTNFLVSPWPGRGLGLYKDSFNYWLSHSRQAIERAFGMLVRRWGIFWRKFVFQMDRWALVCLVTMKLHNFCHDRSDTIIANRFHEDLRDDDEYVVLNNNDEVEDRLLRQRAVGDRRRFLTAELESEGRVSPIHAFSNNKA